MTNKHNFFAVIPARKGSKGIINKNMQLIGQKPMIQYTMESAKKTINLGSFILSSDDDEILKLAKKIGVQAPFIRPKSLSLDNSKTEDVVSHALEWYKKTHSVLPKNIVLLQPTSPFRNAEDISMAIKLFNMSSKKSLISVTTPSQHPGDCMIREKNEGFMRLEITKNLSGNLGRQSYLETAFIDGSIYIVDTNDFLLTNKLIGNNPEVMYLPQSHAIDIDTQFDLDVARAMHNSGIFS